MEKKSVLVLLLLTLVFAPLPLAVALTEPTSCQLHPLADIDIWIDALSYHSFYFTDCETDARIYGSFEVTYGTSIDFCICDRATLEAWDSGNSVSVYELHNNVGSLSYSFYIPYDGIWHIVFRNDDLFYSRHIEGTVYYASPAAQDGSLPMIPLLALGGVVLLVIAVIACSQRGKQKARPVAAGGQGYVPERYLPSSQPVTQIAYCPNCGAPRRSPEDRYCGNCGRPLGSGPDLR